MPVLDDPQYEQFAQNLASGTMDQLQAYEKAGFTPEKSNASRLRHKTAIDKRVKEILTQKNRKLVEKSAHEVETTRELILGELEEARQIAKKARNGSAMAMCSLGKAKVQGLIIDRREIGDVGTFDSKTDEELIEEAKQRAERLGLPAPSIN